MKKKKTWFDWVAAAFKFMVGVGIISGVTFRITSLSPVDGIRLFIFNMTVVWLALEYGMGVLFKSLDIFKTEVKK